VSRAFLRTEDPVCRYAPVVILEKHSALAYQVPRSTPDVTWFLARIGITSSRS